MLRIDLPSTFMMSFYRVALTAGTPNLCRPIANRAAAPQLASTADMPQIRRATFREAPVAAIDYEAEYNNRARVPEHPQIFARWTYEAELYRAEMLKADRAELGLTYGGTPRQSVDLFLAAGHDNAPLAIFIHGGWWRSLEPSTFSQMARGPNGRGISVAVVGYDLCPNVTIADILEQMRRMCAFLWQRFGQRMMVYGHSAGGHLAAALLATDWRTLYPKAPADLVPAAYSISGVFDLTPLLATSVNQDLRLDPAQARQLSPRFWPVAAGRIFDAVVGGLESGEFKRQSSTIAQAWQQTGAQTRYEEVAGTNHFTVIDPLSDPQSAMAARVADLAKAVGP
jgi:arylformamidase